MTAPGHTAHLAHPHLRLRTRCSRKVRATSRMIVLAYGEKLGPKERLCKECAAAATLTEVQAVRDG